MSDFEGFLPAFKEWQVVCDALALGEQSLILRKGGIAEGRQGFRWQHDGFFLFPTRFHQQTDGVRGQRKLAAESTQGEIRLSLWAEINFAVRIDNRDTAAALAPHHIWTPKVVRERFDWGDEPGLSVALVRVRRLERPWILRNADRREFGGCRSWLKLPRGEWEGEDLPEERIADARPVIDEVAFAQKAEELRGLLGRLH